MIFYVYVNGNKREARLERGEPFSKAHARRGCYTPGHKREKKCDWIPMTRFHMWSRIVMLMRRFSSRSAGVFRQPPLSSYSAPDRPTERATDTQANTCVIHYQHAAGFYNPHSALIYMMYIDGHQIRHSSLSLCSCCALWFNRWLILLCDKELVCNWIVRALLNYELLRHPLHEPHTILCSGFDEMLRLDTSPQID